MTRKNITIGNRRKPKGNALKICFSCGCKIFDRRTNAHYCKECTKAYNQINKIVRVTLYHKNLRQRFLPHTFKIHIEIVKKRADTS